MDGLSSWLAEARSPSPFPCSAASLSDYDELFAEKLDLLVALRNKQSVMERKIPATAGQRHDLPRQEDHHPHLGGRWRHAEFGRPGRGTLGLPMALRDHRWRPAFTFG